MEDEGARRAAAAVWRLRARAELVAAERFSRLSYELESLGAVAPVVTMAREAASDERRHAEQCVELARWFGEAAAAPPVPPSRPLAPEGLGLRERVLYEVVAMSCVTETLSAALLGEMAERATDPRARDTMQQILRDEVSHARLGWAHLAVESRRGDAAFVGRHLPAMLAGTVEEELFSSSTEHPAQAVLSGLGSLDRAERRRVFTETMRRVVFPGLERFGISTAAGGRWLTEKLGEAPSRA